MCQLRLWHYLSIYLKRHSYSAEVVHIWYVVVIQCYTYFQCEHQRHSQLSKQSSCFCVNANCMLVMQPNASKWKLNTAETNYFCFGVPSGCVVAHMSRWRERGAQGLLRFGPLLCQEEVGEESTRWSIAGERRAKRLKRRRWKRTISESERPKLPLQILTAKAN